MGVLFPLVGRPIYRTTGVSSVGRATEGNRRGTSHDGRPTWGDPSQRTCRVRTRWVHPRWVKPGRKPPVGRPCPETPLVAHTVGSPAQVRTYRVAPDGLPYGPRGTSHTSHHWSYPTGASQGGATEWVEPVWGTLRGVPCTACPWVDSSVGGTRLGGCPTWGVCAGAS